MGWAKEKPKDIDLSTIKEERLWVSAYADSQERWISDFGPHYKLVAEYEIDECSRLYRFKRNDSLLHELAEYSAKFHNVVISRSK